MSPMASASCLAARLMASRAAQAGRGSGAKAKRGEGREGRAAREKQRGTEGGREEGEKGQLQREIAQAFAQRLQASSCNENRLHASLCLGTVETTSPFRALYGRQRL